jgi:hypothetical protein
MQYLGIFSLCIGSIASFEGGARRSFLLVFAGFALIQFGVYFVLQR